MSTDSPEELLDAFKAAALSVTKLYKKSASAQAKARTEGYQDCLDDLLSFLDKENIGRGDGDGWKIRRWATERLDGRDVPAQTVESEDEADKAEANSSTQLSATQNDTMMRTDSAPPSLPPTSEEPEIVVPSEDTFNFRSQIPYPQESYLEIANLDLSDNRSNDTSSRAAGATPSITISSRPTRGRHGGSGARSGPRPSNHLGRGAGQKRKLNLPEIFDLSSIPSIGYEKDMFGTRPGKRHRHA